MCPVCRDGVAPIPRSPTPSELEMLAVDGDAEEGTELQAFPSFAVCIGAGFARPAASRYNGCNSV